MKLILVRHGETVDNAKRLIQGSENNKLTEKGKEQSIEVGKLLKKYKIDMVFCSPLERCVETLNNILKECPIDEEIIMSRLLEERIMGEYVGTSSENINWKEVDEDNKVNKEMGVESLTDFEKRVNLFLEDLKLEDGEKTILIVSHGGPIKIMVNKITGEKVDVKNAQIMEFDYNTDLEY